MSSEKDTRHRSYRAILWYVTQFCLAQRFGDKLLGLTDGFTHAGEDAPAMVGDLVVPTSTPISEWNISWLNEITNHRYGPTYLLESVETGKECNWSNIGIDFLDRDAVAKHPEWRWTDRQFRFNDRWKSVCFKDHDAYITLPLDASFGSGFEVTLGTRTRFGFDDYRPSETFPDWRKVTKKMMSDLYARFVEDKPAKAHEAAE